MSDAIYVQHVQLCNVVKLLLKQTELSHPFTVRPCYNLYDAGLHRGIGGYFIGLSFPFLCPLCHVAAPVGWLEVPTFA